jgi:hypothetical protein
MFERCPNEDASPHFDLESRLLLFEWPQFENEKARRVGSTWPERAEKARDELFDGVGARAPTSFELEPTLFELEWRPVAALIGSTHCEGRDENRCISRQGPSGRRHGGQQTCWMHDQRRASGLYAHVGVTGQPLAPPSAEGQSASLMHVSTLVWQ